MGRIPKERQGRGRLSRLDMLPDEAQPHLVWLNGELRAGKRPQIELRDVFNARLAGLGIEPISNGSFSRYSVRKAMEFRQVDETLRLSRELKETLGIDGADDLTIHVSNKLQVLAVKLMEEEGDNLSAKDIMELGRANQSVVSALKVAAEYRRSQETEFARKVEEAKKDITDIGKAAGVSEETMRKITQRLAGVA